MGLILSIFLGPKNYGLLEILDNLIEHNEKSLQNNNDSDIYICMVELKLVMALNGAYHT